VRRAILLLPLVVLPACEWQREQKPGSPPISIYSIFGRTWGWEGARPLSHEEVIAVSERLKEQNLRRREDRQRIRAERTAERAARRNQRMRAHEERRIRELERRITPTGERYKQMGSKPDRMIVKESSSYLWGTMTQTSVHEYPVSWQDSDAPDAIAVFNTTDQMLFLDLGAEPGKPKELYGIKAGKRRIIPPPPYNQIILWKKQLTDEPVDKLITMIRIVPGSQSLVIEERENGELHALPPQ